MRPCRGFLSFSKNKRDGFALAEVIIAFAALGLAAFLINGLSQQVSNLNKRSRLSGTVIEHRNKFNAISRDPSDWLNTLRSAVPTDGVFAACIPDASNASSLFKCPSVVSVNDPELQKMAGENLHIASVPLVDLMGEKIAGTQDPNGKHYLDLEGRPCEQANAATTCPLISTGYMMRSNPVESANPGLVKIVLKIERNSAALNSNKGMGPMKPQYISVDLGTEWRKVSSPIKKCPSGTIKLGYLANGTPNCVNPTKQCNANQISLGVDTSGNPVCQSAPTCEANNGVMLSAAANQLICTAVSPCSSGQVFLGYAAGTGEKICSSLSAQCGSGQIQVGSTVANNTATPICKAVPSCNAKESISYDGDKFACLATSLASECPDDEVIVGLHEDGTPKCKNIGVAGESCAEGYVMTGFEDDSSPICRPMPTGGKLTSCDAGHYLRGISSTGEADCVALPPGTIKLPLRCTDGFYLRGITADGEADCAENFEDPPEESEDLANASYTQNIPEGSAPSACFQTSAGANVLTRSCTGATYKCAFQNGGWRWLYRSNGNIHSDCAGGISYAPPTASVIISSREDPLPSSVSPSSHEISCMNTAKVSFECENLPSPINKEHAARIPKTSTSPSAVGLCYRTKYYAKQLWIYRKKTATGAASGTEVWCTAGMRAVRR